MSPASPAPPRKLPRKRTPSLPPRQKPGKLPAGVRLVRRRPPAAGRKQALLWGLGAALAVVFGLSLMLYVGFGRVRGPTHQGPVELQWPPGLDAVAAAALLAEHGLVSSEQAMAAFLDATGGTDDFVPGWHLLSDHATPWELRHLLSRAPDRPQARVTLPEGFNRFDVAARLEKLGIAGKGAFLAATTDTVLLDELGIEQAGAVGAESAEGYLFPATYELALDSDPREVVRRLVQESDRRWQILSEQHKDGLATLGATLGWGRREVLTLASMVEKEAVADEERPVIASVFYNRLLDPGFQPKRLQSDPTSIYGCLVAPVEIPACADFTGKATPAINTDPKNRYSTYVRVGIPPGPIANPGVRSVEGVLAPAATRYLYFVAAGGGRHTFSDSLDAHNDAVKRRKVSAP